VPQPPEGATLTRPLRREDAWLDPARGAAALARQVRAYDPWPGAWTEHAGARLIVHAAHARPGSAPAGVSVAAGALVLATADGLLVLDEVQPAGKRRMPAADYARGLRSAAGPSGAGTADRG
jgi:methionyl-tRNA formyltransferase